MMVKAAGLDAEAQAKAGATLDFTDASQIPAQLAGLYLKQGKAQEATAVAETALKIAPANREANRVLGTLYAALSEGNPDASARGRAAPADKGDDCTY